ncbi:MAG: C10 family peptidase [Bacteroidales bacterium]|nr:C10 family peptidase [Bacteroidales bacterium]
MKKLLFLSIFIFFGTVIFAKPISNQEIEYFVKTFYQINFKNVDLTKSTTEQKIFSNNYHAISIFYFESGGFVAMSTDDCFPAVVAYSLNGEYSPQKMSETESLWYQNIGAEMKKTVESDIYANMPKHVSWEKIQNEEFLVNQSKSTQLLTTRWGQGCYYNTLCPEDENGPCGHTVTGCVATAMAQIMKYWNYPQFGFGSHSYDHLVYGTLSADFGATEYLWAQMPDEITEENNALATLMYHCGVAVNMNYAATSSGAGVNTNTFVDYFNYSANLSYVHKSTYSDEDWKDMLRNQIDNGFPMLYIGFSEVIPEGHAWVLDGYDIDDYFHFNWGWDSDGAYYLLDDNFFPLSQCALINVFPKHECDINLGEIIHPINMTYTEPTYISVVVENYGSNTASNIPVSYTVDDEDPVTEIIPETLNPGESIVYQFAQTYDFSQTAGGVYNLKIFSDLECETYRLNDTVSQNVVNVMCADIPYQISEGGDDMGWLIEDGNDDGVKWILSDEGFAPYYPSSTEVSADDWLLSKCISLEQGKLYKLSFDYKGIGIYWFHDIELWSGTAPYSDFMTNELLDLNNLNNEDWQTAQQYFTVDENGSYYFGFHIYSQPEMLSFLIDNFEIVELAEPDVMINDILNPQSSCMLGNEQVSVEITNLSSQILSNITMKYQIGEGEIISETYSEILNPGESAIFNFSSLADLSEYGEYAIKIWSEYLGDTNQDNDSLFVNVKNKTNADLPYSIGFENAVEYEDWIVENVNNDNKTWQFVTSGGYTQPACAKYEYNDFQAADDWLISKCVWLESGFIYRISFWYKVEDGTWPENLKLMMGSTQTNSEMNVLLQDLPSLENNTYQQAEIYFPIYTDEFYYFGFQCYSVAQMFNLYIDDIEIVLDGVNNLASESSDSLIIYPNPAHDVIVVTTNFDLSENANLKLYDLRGRLLIEQKIDSNNFQLDLGSLESGIYYISLSSGEKSSVKRIVKM